MMSLNELSRRDLLKTATAAAAASSLVGLPAAAQNANPGSDGALRRIDQILRQATESKVSPGIVAVAATDHGVIYEGAFGGRDMEGGPNITADTVFSIASMTKAVTGAACMQLVEQGRLQLDEPIGKLLPELASPQVLEGFDASGAAKLRPAKRPITLRHLLTHTSGFVYDAWDPLILEYGKRYHVPSIVTCKTAALMIPLVFDPGERWQYGIGIDWAGRALEAVTDQSLEIYFRENIFAPLGMTDTMFLIGSAQKARMAQKYHRQADGSLKAAPNDIHISQRPEFFMGGGGLISTPRNYLAFLQMLLNGGSFNGARVLKPETVALMGQNSIGAINVVTLKSAVPFVTNDANFFPGMVQKWGLTFDINTEPGPNGRSAGSLCWAGVFNTFFWIDPNKRVTGTYFTQLLPFADTTSLKLYGEFERGVYDAMKSA
jgi:CubicO group peptidase (beta-lactamase class C family)